MPYDDELESAARRDVDERLVDLVTVDGQVFGSWYSVTPKRLVWYSPQQFTERGLTAPTTWDELIDLTDELAAGGAAPWCLGVRDAGATGWVATDWVGMAIGRDVVGGARYGSDSGRHVRVGVATP